MVRREIRICLKVGAGRRGLETGVMGSQVGAVASVRRGEHKGPARRNVVVFASVASRGRQVVCRQTDAHAAGKACREVVSTSSIARHSAQRRVMGIASVVLHRSSSRIVMQEVSIKLRVSGSAPGAAGSNLVHKGPWHIHIGIRRWQIKCRKDVAGRYRESMQQIGSREIALLLPNSTPNHRVLRKLVRR
jgi:hypothetical protein